MHHDSNHFPMHRNSSSYLETKRNMTSITQENKGAEEVQNWGEGKGASDEKLPKTNHVTCPDILAQCSMCFDAYLVIHHVASSVVHRYALRFE